MAGAKRGPCCFKSDAMAGTYDENLGHGCFAKRYLLLAHFRQAGQTGSIRPMLRASNNFSLIEFGDPLQSPDLRDLRLTAGLMFVEKIEPGLSRSGGVVLVDNLKKEAEDKIGYLCGFLIGHMGASRRDGIGLSMLDSR